MLSRISCKCGTEHHISCSEFANLQAKGITQLSKCSHCKAVKASKREEVKVVREGKDKKFDGANLEVTK